MNNEERLQQMTRQQHQHEYVCRGVFERKGALSYIGHLDLKAVFERALRRAELPLLYTQGFNPRPMLVFALPLGVGIDTEGDYFDVSMEVPVEPEEYLSRINAELPDGLRVLSAVSIDEPKNSLMSVVTCASYRIEAPGITDAVLKVFEQECVETMKKSKGREIKVDIRPLLIKPLTSSTPDAAEYMCYAGSQQNLRPDVLLKALCETVGYDEKLALEARVTRRALYGGTYPDLTSIEGLL
jgi:radical SAM-linked protein